MRRGDVWLADLEPVRGSEANKVRPVVVVSNDGANARTTTLGRGVVTVVPVTSNTSIIRSFHVLLPAEDTGLPADSKAQAEQVRSLDVTRLIRRVGHLPRRLVERLDAALRLHLDL